MNQPKRFIVAGDSGVSYTLQQMLAANRDDEDLCDWLVQAQPGDRFPCGLGCDCVAWEPAVEFEDVPL